MIKDVIDTLETPAECDQLIKNVEKRNPELAKRALRKKIEIQAVKHGAKSDAEREAYHTLYAYEEILSQMHGGKRTRAARTRQMIDRHGIIETVERLVNQKQERKGFRILADLGMLDLTAEALVLRYPHLFSPGAVSICKKRIKNLEENPSVEGVDTETDDD